MKYRYLTTRGAIHEGGHATASPDLSVKNLANRPIEPDILELIPESVARENTVIPIAFDGETVLVAAATPDDIALADKLRFLLAINVELVFAKASDITVAIDRNYGAMAGESADSMLQEFTDSALDLSESVSAPAGYASGSSRKLRRKKSKRNLRAMAGRGAMAPRGYDEKTNVGGNSMFFYTVEEGQRVLLRRLDGTMEVLTGPRRVWRGWNTFQPMQHFVAHPGEFLIVRFRDGRQQHLDGPCDIWLDSREHLSIAQEDALQLAAKEAVVVYCEQDEEVSRRIVYGPTTFIPQPGEWLHEFSWHASRGGSKGAQKKPNSLVFQKLWLMPDQMYHDVPDVRTADDAVLTIRLMIFFELQDIERMLDATHDPIGDMVNATTSDVVEFTGKHEFESFKQNTNKLNELATYEQLVHRATQCGYRINNVVYRGYGAPDSLQKMHDQAIEARTRLQLERATEQQAQDLEDYKLECQLARASKRRTEQASEVQHDLELDRHRGEAKRKEREANAAFQLTREREKWDLREEFRRGENAQQEEHLHALRDLGVDLTAYLTQARADRVIELRGGENTHVHLDDE